MAKKSRSDARAKRDPKRASAKTERESEPELESESDSESDSEVASPAVLPSDAAQLPPVPPGRPTPWYAFAVIGGLCAAGLIGVCVGSSDDKKSDSDTEQVSASTEQPASAPPSGADQPVGTEGLVIQDIKVGEGPAAASGDTVSVHYVGVLKEGAEFDSSRPRGQPFEVKLGQGRVIKGWDQGLVGMKAGGQRKLIIPPALGYGPQGMPPKIPAGATLVFMIDMLEVKKP